ncbi:G2/M phase-specific E3 ubiquitin-protein ligase [Nematostella vectensis]|uniref:G2/M phase-specific E3 ubiquitin-protein ligase n=1 Tax=Nematostella vectensis TaxID=45351 RepID=UPI00138FE538|nr:G2/M phase-specific E3 ubiquitin-protein ligase [Nematostella vectensis]
MEGLKTCCMLGLVQAYPEKFRTVFEVPKELTAEMLDDIFDVKYSPRDSNKFHAETEVIFNFTQYLEDIEKGQISSVLEGKEVVVTLNHVIQFVTGSHGIPAIGFTPRPSIHFNHDSPNRKLTANTCANQLTLTVDGRIRQYEHFSRDFTFCMFNSRGFGLL